MDKKKSALNVCVSLSFKLVTMIAAIWVRRTLILNCGNDVNGLNSLYLSIIGFLSVAELGVGSAITFCMYRPIVEGNDQKVSALYYLFRRLYLLIGSVILICGLLLTPFVHYFARDYEQIDVNLHSTFILMLLSVAITYLFGAELSLLNAHKNNYITTTVSSGGLLLQYALQILVLKVTGSFHSYLVCRIVAALAQWLVSRVLARKNYSHILRKRQRVDADTRKELEKHIRAMFMHKVGNLLVNKVDSLVIAAYIGVSALGNYTNYTVIQSSMDNVIKLVFTSLTSILGHLYVEKNKQTVQRYYEAFHLLNFILGTVFYLGYYAVADSLVAMLFSPELVAAKTVRQVIALNGFVQFMRIGTLSFRDATGTFYYDRWKPMVEGAVNLILSLLLVQRIGVTGVIAATILTNLLICHVVEPYVLYKHALSASLGKFYLRNYAMIVVFGLGVLVVDQLAVSMEYWAVELLCNGFISLGVSLVLCVGVLLSNWQQCRILLGVLRRRSR